MIKFLFEDNLNTPSSILLKSSYNGKNIHFTSGNLESNILNKIESLIDENDNCTLVVFYDLPPNNKVIYNNYERPVDRVIENNYDDVHIVPIICIEYYLIKFLVLYNYIPINNKNIELINNLVISFDYTNSSVINFVNKDTYRKNSLEHVYKQLLSYLIKSKCMLNYSKTNNLYGIFLI